VKIHRFKQITGQYASLRIAIVGDFCLDRYFDIDPARQEMSIETGLPVHNIVRVRCQPGAAGTILNNLVALGVGRIYPIGICGDDGEGFELRRSLETRAGTDLAHFVRSPERRTFTYTKPLVFEQGKPPVELSRLDIKNWTTTPDRLQNEVIAAFRNVVTKVDAVILLDQVDVAETGVITAKVLQAVRDVVAENPGLLIVGDSRRGLKDYPQVSLKMNRAELAAMVGHEPREVAHVTRATTHIAAAHGRPVFVTLAERGIVGADPGHEAIHRDALPLRGEIDIVGAGDSVTANLTAALAAGADIEEALEMAVAASSIVIHQLGTTGTASPPEIQCLMEREGLLK
jgi:rfaE bifunctional protein kinase chain/domain